MMTKRDELTGTPRHESMFDPLSVPSQALETAQGKKLMADVTSAVFKAEHSIEDTIRYYDDLVRAEQAVVDCPEVSKFDRAVAKRGVENASRILAAVRAAWEGSDP